MEKLINIQQETCDHWGMKIALTYENYLHMKIIHLTTVLFYGMIALIESNFVTVAEGQ